MYELKFFLKHQILSYICLTVTNIWCRMFELVFFIILFFLPTYTHFYCKILLNLLLMPYKVTV